MKEILFGTGSIKLLQSLSPSLNWLFILFTWLGDDLIFGASIGLIYWCWNKKEAAKLLYLIAISGYLNYVLKSSLALPRPPMELRIVDKESLSYSFPSGHSQSAATFWGWLGIKGGKKTLDMAIIIVFLVALSRVYLGVHYPGDVLAGVVIGGLCAWAAIKLERIFPGKLSRFTFIAPVLALLLFFLSLRLFPEAGRGDPSASLGSLLGFSLGVIGEGRYINFTTEISLWKKFFRTLIGFTLMSVFMFGAGPWLSGSVYLKLIKYALVTFSGAFLAPLIFKIVKLD